MKWLGITISFPLFYLLLYQIPRDNGLALTGIFFLWTILIFQTLRPSQLLHIRLPLLLLLALAIRSLALTATPPWTDDFYRFLWDGELISKGINPFSLLPSELSSSMKVPLEMLNSEKYYSIYPPFMQGIFGFGSVISMGRETIALSGIRTCYILADLFNIYLIYKLLKYFKLSPGLSIFYIFHPLVLMEFTANLHLEVFMITGLLAFAYGLLKNRPVIWITGLAFAIHIKLIPLLIIPFLIFRNRTYLPGALAAVILAFIPFIPFWLNGGFLHWLESLRLYSSHFEFNGSIYYLLRWMGYQIKGFNLIHILGPGLAMISLALILWVSYRSRNIKLDSAPGVFGLFALIWLLFYLFSTTVHPWYLAPLVVFALFSKFRFALVAPVTVVFSYLAYSMQPFSEPVWLSIIVYLPIAGAIFADRDRISKLLQLNK